MSARLFAGASTCATTVMLFFSVIKHTVEAGLRLQVDAFISQCRHRGYGLQAKSSVLALPEGGIELSPQNQQCRCLRECTVLAQELKGLIEIRAKSCH